MRVKTWKVLRRGRVAADAQTIPYDCACGHEAELPVSGRVIAIMSGGGIVFDTPGGAIPAKIQCRRCGRVFERDRVG